MTFSPKFGYEIGNNALSRADHIWYNNHGQKIGVWLEDWGFQLGVKIIGKYQNIKWEVWRPDVRAEKVYSHTFYNNLTTKSFPIEYVRLWSGIRKSNFIYSPQMLNYLEKYIKDKPRNKEYLLILPASRNAFAIKLRDRFQKEIAVHYNHFLYAKILLGQYSFKLNPIECLHKNIKAWQQKQFMNPVESLMVAHRDFIPAIQNQYNCKVHFNTMGADLTYWKSTISKEKAKEKLSIAKYGHVFLFSSRLAPEYQIHKILGIIREIKGMSFHCIFTSQGPEKYMKLLDKLVKKYEIEDKVTFTGYVEKTKLKLLYTASDTFFMTSITNAGPMSTFIAMLMEKQVITTDAGLASEILKENNCGLIVSPSKYSEWLEAMKFAICEGEIELVDTNIIKELFDWKIRIQKWHEIFEQALNIHKVAKVNIQNSIENDVLM